MPGPPRSRPTVHEVVEAAARALAAAGLPEDDARLDARVIVRHVLGLTPEALIVASRDEVAPEPLGEIQRLVTRRQAREPVAYLVGHREFYGRDFEVSPAVLVPRPETELIVDLALECVGNRWQPITVVDIGTGSGCLAVTLACELPAATVIATDVSSKALRVARANAVRHGVADRLVLVQGSGAGAVTRAELVVSNPPYVAWTERERLPPEVREYEPAVALFGGDDGLDVIRLVVDEAGRILSPASGWLLLEIGVGQDAAVRAILAADGRFHDVDVVTDLQGIPRTVRARRGRSGDTSMGG